jgi:uncharacterized damage-inducible protein DinB
MEMKHEYVLVALDYNEWADRVALKAAQQLPQDVLHARQPMGFGAIFETLVHMMDSQRVWLRRWQDVSPAPFSTLANYATLDQLETAWEALHAEFRDFVAGSNLERPITYTTTQSETYTHPLGLLLWHILNHGVEHRSELSAIFTQAGYKLARMDFITYLRTVARF